MALETIDLPAIQAVGPELIQIAPMALKTRPPS
jgi:hypothetical protein